MTLPADYFNTWATEQSGLAMDRDSRVTASGFTTATGKEMPVSVPHFYQQPQANLSTKNLSKFESETKSQRSESVVQQSMDEVKEMVDRMDSARSTEPLRVNKGRTPEQQSRSPFGDEYVTMDQFTKFASELSISPGDSASVVQPRQVTRLPIRLQAITEMTSEIPTQSVIGGYKQSIDDKIRELQSYQDVEPVNGLPIIFTNPRLNFLTHVHSALFKIITDDNGNYPAKDCGELLMSDRRTWSMDPSTVLLETVLDRTIDKRSGVVVANPFNVPILEPAMKLTPRLVFMAFDQLHSEFETEWFNTMKSVTTPKFHSKYEDNKYRRHSRNSSSRSSNERRNSASTGSARSGQSVRTNRGGSVLGSILGLD
jgi:hypothetical protein